MYSEEPAMKRLPLLGSYAGLLAVAISGLVFLRPELPIGSRTEPGKANALRITDADLERERITTLNHVEARIRLARAVIAGQLTLRQGAEQLRDLHAVNPYFKWEYFRSAYTGESDVARCCEQLQETIDDLRAEERFGDAKRVALPITSAAAKADTDH
jgi:hypothetical protein